MKPQLLAVPARSDGAKPDGAPAAEPPVADGLPGVRRKNDVAPVAKPTPAPKPASGSEGG
jgi:hypothetical protein